MVEGHADNVSTMLLTRKDGERCYIRTVTWGEKTYFVARDIADALGINNTTNATEGALATEKRRISQHHLTQGATGGPMLILTLEGTRQALEWCDRHGRSPYACELLAWLMEGLGRGHWKRQSTHEPRTELLALHDLLARELCHRLKADEEGENRTALLQVTRAFLKDNGYVLDRQTALTTSRNNDGHSPVREDPQFPELPFRVLEDEKEDA